MADNYEQLTAEIHRIVNSPYPTQLKHLRDILYSKCSAADISRWAELMPCQIDRLISEVLEGLQYWPYVLDIVERLSSDRTVRDAFLRAEPTLLRDIIVQASKSADVHSRYTATAAAMLSHPLPQTVSLAAEIQSIFVRSFEQAAEAPSVQSIKPIYHMLQGTSEMLLSLLSSTVLLRFEEQLFGILKNVKGDNQSLCLYCLAIMKVLSTSSDERMAFLSESYDTQELLASTHITPSRWTSDTIKQFFSGSKAQKTMQLIVLRAMWACTTTNGEPVGERLEGLRLANEIIDAVPEELREVWRKDNALIVRKLEEKVLASGLESSSRFPAICFLLRLTEGHVHPATAMDALRQMLKRDLCGELCAYSGNDGDIVYVIRCGTLDQNTTTTLLQNLVDMVTSSTPSYLVESSSSLNAWLQGLLEVMAERDEIVEGTMLALDVLSCGRKLQDLAKLCRQSDQVESSGIEICQQAAQGSINRLVHCLCKLFLTAAISSRQSTYSISHEAMALLLELHVSSSHVSRSCCHVNSRASAKLPGFAFAEESGTPESVSSNWREALQSHLESRNSLEQANLIRLFTKSCSELEARCEEVEHPLRDQQAKMEALQRRYDELSDAYAQLEAEGIDRGIQFNAMEMERDQCLTDLETAREENGEQERRIFGLERDLEQAKADSDGSIARIRSEMEMAELEHARVATRLEEELEQVREKKLAIESDLAHKEEELEDVQCQRRDLHSTTLGLKREIDDLRTSLEELQTAHNGLQNDKHDISGQKRELEDQIGSMKQEISAAQKAHEQELTRLQKTAEEERNNATEANEAKIAMLIEQHEVAKAELIKHFENLERQHQEMMQTHNASTAQMQQDIDEKQRWIDKLKSRCEHKDKRIAEANAMRSNLMAAMGINGTGLKQTKLAHRPAASFDAQSQSQAFDSQDPSPPTPLSADDDETQPSKIGASFASSTDSRSGPTPKRARPRRTTKVASPAKSQISTARTTRSVRKSVTDAAGVENTDTSKRKPLSFISGNEVPRRSTSAKTPPKALENAIDPMDESTFDGSELSTGTQGEQLLGLGEQRQSKSLHIR